MKTITVRAFPAVAAALPLGPVGCEPEINSKGERLISIELRYLLVALCGKGESFSGIIFGAAPRSLGADDGTRRPWKIISVPLLNKEGL